MRSKAPTVSEAVGTRMSVRDFTDRPVEGALIRRVLETPAPAGRWNSKPGRTCRHRPDGTAVRRARALPGSPTAAMVPPRSSRGRSKSTSRSTFACGCPAMASVPPVIDLPADQACALKNQLRDATRDRVRCSAAAGPAQAWTVPTL